MVSAYPIIKTSHSAYLYSLRLFDITILLSLKFSPSSISIYLSNNSFTTRSVGHSLINVLLHILCRLMFSFNLQCFRILFLPWMLHLLVLKLQPPILLPTSWRSWLRGRCLNTKKLTGQETSGNLIENALWRLFFLTAEFSAFARLVQYTSKLWMSFEFYLKLL